MRLEADEFSGLLRGQAQLSRLEFVGHDKRVGVEGEEILKDFESAFKTPAKNAMTGTAYNIWITFRTGVTVKTDIYVSDSPKGFLIADYGHLIAGEPTYMGFEFPHDIRETSNELLKGLVLP
jgi:hypothetical protein